MGEALSHHLRLEMCEETKHLKVLTFVKFWSSKSRARTESHNGFHLLERMLVAADCLVGRNERMWQITESGNALILSAIGIERLKAIQDSQLKNTSSVVSSLYITRSKPLD
jgi:hypothetical protein